MDFRSKSSIVGDFVEDVWNYVAFEARYLFYRSREVGVNGSCALNCELFVFVVDSAFGNVAHGMWLMEAVNLPCFGCSEVLFVERLLDWGRCVWVFLFLGVKCLDLCSYGVREMC